MLIKAAFTKGFFFLSVKIDPKISKNQKTHQKKKRGEF